jgi:glycosyltransferase involved in cell wall biosynthesis
MPSYGFPQAHTGLPFLADTVAIREAGVTARSAARPASKITAPVIRTEAARPLLTLCLATYNRARYLDRYLTHHLTAFEAAGLDYELLVSDNCSTDETPEILARYAARHPRMKVVRQNSNIGAHANIMWTFYQARGQFVVSISDDDMMVPHQLLNYVRRMDEDRDLVMLQSPWYLLDETRDNAIIGKFYDLPAERRFSYGDYAPCLEFLLNGHIFPECWLLRTDAVSRVIGTPHRYAYNYFNMLTRALSLGDVLFSPEPHITATAIAKGQNAHVGNSEVMEGWDMYRGGLELLASYAQAARPSSLNGPALSHAIQMFTLSRMQVAARFHAMAKNWSSAYHLSRRIHAYGVTPDIGIDHANLATLAALETALTECAQLGAGAVAMEAGISDRVLEQLKVPDNIRLGRPGMAAAEKAIAFCGSGKLPDNHRAGFDFAYDLTATLHRFPALT